MNLGLGSFCEGKDWSQYGVKKLTFEQGHIEWTLEIVHLSHHHIYDMKLNLRIVVVV